MGIFIGSSSSLAISSLLPPAPLPPPSPRLLERSLLIPFPRLCSVMDPLRQSLNPHKRLKEEFVSDLTGSSILEIAALSTIIPGLVILRQLSNFARLNGKVNAEAVPSKKDDDSYCTRHFRSCAISFILDYLFVVLPVLLILTILADWSYVSALLLILFLRVSISAKRSSHSYIKGEQHLSSLRTIISSYRVLVVVMTCLCILAVDFKIFPRRYAKTETYGTSLMDLGVGSFVIANALVSRKARNSISMNWMAMIKSVSPLIFLGFGRLISTTGVDYQVHVGEYGVHWNFFFTLAGVSLLSSLFDIHPKYCGIFGLLILIGYQACLLYGLNIYLISNERSTDLISQNKEGIFSIFGYWGMYLIGVHLGHYILFGNYSSKKGTNIQSTRASIWTLTVFFWILTIILDNYVERVSRRMCNLAYVMLVLAQNFQVISVLMLAGFIPGQKLLALEEAFDQNLLGSFLLANVLTGIVNLSVDTLSASSVASIGILLGYSFLLSAVTGVVWFYGIKIKFW